MGNKPNDAAREPRLSPSIKDLAAKAKQAAVKAPVSYTHLRNVVTIDVLSNHGCLMSDLENVLRVVLIKERQIYLCAILALKDKLIPQDFCTLEN